MKAVTVALIGPDGAGKTTVARRLEEELERPIRYLYMGVNADSSNHALPTTRLVQALRGKRGAGDTRGPREHADVRHRPRQGVKRPVGAAKSSLRLANRMAEEWYRQLLASYHRRRGRIVIFDRHFFSDYHAYDVTGGEDLPLSRRIHGFTLSHLYPRPDLVVYLDAPGEILLARKGEGTLDSLERRRREYLDVGSITQHFVVVDASRPLEDVVDEVAAVVETFAATGVVSADTTTAKSNT
jgi:thymidylate kinase